MHQNMSLASNGVDRVRSMQKKLRRAFVERTFALIAPVWPILHRVLCCNQVVQKTSKLYETHHNIGLRYNGVDRWRSL